MITKTKPVCASCPNFDTVSISMSKEQLKPEWLEKVDYVRKFIDNHDFKSKHVLGYDNIIQIKLNKRYIGRKVLYWCANKKNTKSPLIRNARAAYGNFENSGVVKINNDGIAVFKFDCPQLYKTKHVGNKNLTTFFRHIHFVIEDSNPGVWKKQIYTKILSCSHNIVKLLEDRNEGYSIILNTLPCEYYAKDHIMGSYNLPVNVIKNMTANELRNWFTDIVKIHYPKLYNYLKSKKLDITECQIITYCAHKNCKTSEEAGKELMKKGFVNINTFAGGMKEYREKFKHDL